MSDKSLCSHKNENISASISFLRFPLTVMIVMYHCYCVQTPHNQPLYAAFIYPFGLILGETGVPAFFFVSGFLFFYSQRSFSQKLRTRVSTLLVPYLFWNSLILLVYVGLMLLGKPMEIADKNIADFHFIDFIRAFIDRGKWDNGNGQPLLCPYWYVRNLMVLSIVAPLLQMVIRGAKGIVTLSVLLAWWMILPYNGMVAQSLLFFCMGAFFSVNRINPSKLFGTLQRIILVSVWTVLACLDWLSHFCISMEGGLFIHRLVLTLNIFILWRVAGRASARVYTPLILEKSSFWIYTIHYPFTLIIREIRPALFDYEQIIFYSISVAIIVMLSIATYRIGQITMPRLLSVITGNR